MEPTYEPLPRDRVLAVDPVSRGFGFVVLETGPLQLVDWGVRICARREEDACANAVRRMIARYEPTAIVIEDAREARTLRAVSLEAFLGSIAEALSGSSIALRTYSRRDIRRAFASEGAVTKEQIAKVLVARFPELRVKEPPRRMLWESEDARMSIFDALSLATTHFVSGDG
ncbi:MAG: crossover junction endodeoxyribonuclease RuvC [Planctomycetota bacterium]